MARIAAATDRIRVGSGGMLLPLHAPLALAEQAAVLDALFRGRIDLGFGRGSGTLDETAIRALRRGVPMPEHEEYEREAAELAGYTSPAGRGPDGVVVAAGHANHAELWVPASSADGAGLAARLGLPLSFAHHLRPDDTESAQELYRRAFTPSDRLAEPRVMVSCLAVCAETADRAEFFTWPWYVSLARQAHGDTGPLPAAAGVTARELTDDERAAFRHPWALVTGTPAAVAVQLADLVNRTDADELLVMTPVYDPAARARSIELLAAATG